MTALPKVYFDTNVFIAAYETVGALSDHACWLMEAVENGRMLAATSELTLAEMLCKPARERNRERIEGYEQLFRPSTLFEIMPVQRNILVESAFLRAEISALRLPDAIHLASARSMGCTAFVTNDIRLNGGKMRIVRLGPFTVDEILGTPL